MIGILLILDGLGIGAMEDSEQYGDSSDVNTLKNVLEVGKIEDFPVLNQLGLFKLLTTNTIDIKESVIMKLCEASKGKDTITGHWEMMGIITQKSFPVLADGFPKDLVDFIEDTIGRKVIGLKNISGTTILEQYGHLHLETHFPIVYTSTDSVIQIAADESIIPLKILYDWCEKIHKNLPEPYKVARVIARPFITEKNKFIRTSNRKDFSIMMPKPNSLSRLEENGISLYSLGKITDIYKGTYFTTSKKINDNIDGMACLIQQYQSIKEGLILINLNDFDSKYGHRRDAKGYYSALKAFDEKLGELLSILKDDDFILITGDHGCDPTDQGTNHTREKVPYLLYSRKFRSLYGYKGERKSFSIVGETLEAIFMQQFNELHFEQS